MNSERTVLFIYFDSLHSRSPSALKQYGAIKVKSTLIYIGPHTTIKMHANSRSAISDGRHSNTCLFYSVND